jgi:hypothetical protein
MRYLGLYEIGRQSFRIPEGLAARDSRAAMRDPVDPIRIRDDLHMGDHIHGNDVGYKALVDSIDLSVFD